MNTFVRMSINKCLLKQENLRNSAVIYFCFHIVVKALKHSGSPKIGWKPQNSKDYGVSRTL